MKILMTNQSLSARAGSESYLETVSAELRRLGHEVVFYSPRCGEVAASVRAAGFEVVERVEDLPTDVDVVHAQHGEPAAQVRTRLLAPMVFVTHSWFVSIEDPLPELGAAAFVAFNEVTHRRLQAHVATSGGELVRLTQPVTVSFADPVRTRPSASDVRAVAVSRGMREMPGRLAEACAALGYSFDWVGGPERESADAREEMRVADIVFAVGRTALEAMAMGRATFILDELTIGGWVSRASYAALEADGFTGYVARADPANLTELLGNYRPELGAEARHLAAQHHAAPLHAVDLVELYTRVADRPVVSTVPDSLGRLAHERFVLEDRAVRAEWRAAELRRELETVRAELDLALQQRDRFREQRDRFRRQRNRLRGRLTAELDDPPASDTRGGWAARLRRR